jgi:hypothetical protein
MEVRPLQELRSKAVFNYIMSSRLDVISTARHPPVPPPPLHEMTTCRKGRSEISKTPYMVCEQLIAARSLRQMVQQLSYTQHGALTLKCKVKTSKVLREKQNRFDDDRPRSPGCSRHRAGLQQSNSLVIIQGTTSLWQPPVRNKYISVLF